MDEPVKGHCMRCKTERTMKDPKEVKMKTGMRAAKGTCSNCGCKMIRFLGK